MAVHSCLTRGGVAGMIIPSIKKKHENEHGWLGNPSWTKMYVLLKMGIPYCHVSFGGSVHVCLLDPTHPWWCRNFSDQQEAESEKSYLHLSDSGRKPSTANPEINGGFWFPLIGGRGYIIPQLAVYTTYIPLIYCLLGVICYRSHLLGGTRNNHWVRWTSFRYRMGSRKTRKISKSRWAMKKNPGLFRVCTVGGLYYPLL